MEDYARPIPMRVIAEMMGIPQADAQKVAETGSKIDVILAGRTA